MSGAIHTGVKVLKGTAAALLAALLLSGAAQAQYGKTPPTTIDPEILKIKEGDYLGSNPGLEYPLVDDSGRSFTIKDINSRPLVLLLSYYRCDGACPTTNRKLKAMVDGLRRARPGKDFNILTLSFDRYDTPERIRMFRKSTGIEKDAPGWRIALFKNPGDIKKFTGQVGYRFFWSPRDRIFIHPNVYIILSPRGRITRYLYAANTGAGDLDVAIAEANFGTVGRSKVDDLGDLLLVACYSYNFKEGRYTLNYPLFIGAGSLFLGLSFFVISLVVSRKKRRR